MVTKIFNKDLMRNKLIKKCNITNSNIEILDIFLEDLYDLSKKSIAPFNKQETYIFRKLNGIYDNGIEQTIDIVAKQFNVVPETISKLNIRMFTHLLVMFERELPYYSKKRRMTSLELFPKSQELNNISVGDLNLDKRIFNLFRRQIGIYTIGELLSYSLSDLIIMGLSNKMINNLSDCIHSRGLKFIDELSVDEKKEIIAKNQYDTVLNSSIYWLNKLKIPKVIVKCNNLDNISALIRFANENHILNEFMDCAEDVNIDLNFNKKTPQDIVYTLDELLKFSLEILNVPIKIIQKLQQLGIYTLNELVNVGLYKLKMFFIEDIESYRELVFQVHNLGIFFIDEADLVTDYSNAIYSSLLK